MGEGLKRSGISYCSQEHHSGTGLEKRLMNSVSRSRNRLRVMLMFLIFGLNKEVVKSMKLQVTEESRNEG